MKNSLFLLCVSLLFAGCTVTPEQKAPDFSNDAVWTITVQNLLEGKYFGISSANGQIGIISSRKPLKTERLVVSGLFDTFGYKATSVYFNNINPLDVEMRLNGELVNEQSVSDYSQQFDFRNAMFSGHFSQSGANVDYRVVALRHLPFCYMMEVEIEGCDNVELLQRHSVPSLLLNPRTETRHVVETEVPEDLPSPEYDVVTTTALSPAGKRILSTSSVMITDTIADNKLRYTIFCSTMGDNWMPDPRSETERMVLYAAVEGRERTLMRHEEAWRSLWESDILIEGDEQAQQDIHNMLYHIYAFNRKDNPYSISPMGLSGFGYYGHVFWDMETYMFPVICAMHPEEAKHLVDFRFNHLEMACKNAYERGYEGALYPWEDDDTGQETTPSIYLFNLQHHINSDVALAIWQYYCITGDKNWLKDKGYPVLKAIADFWVSRVEKGDDGKLHIRKVMGSDEWGLNEQGGVAVDDDAFTIGGALKSLEMAGRAARLLGLKEKNEWKQTAQNLDYVYLDNGIIAEHSTYKGERIKQADVTLLAYPLGLMTDTSKLRATIEYYKARTPSKRTPGMSNCIDALLYARIQDKEATLNSFRQSYLPNLTPPFRQIAEYPNGSNPYFLTCAGGTLQAIIFGCAGLEITEKGLEQKHNPILPDEWKSLTIRRKGEKDIIIKH